jgi:glyoxylase-like metal-dependent hydrolase (beta-lactamase superfamily II)
MTLSRLDDVTRLVRAPNPSPMTLEGTNTYVLGAPDAGATIVVDPGPDILDHRRALDAALVEADAEVAAVVLTHHHPDHAEAAGWADDWGAPLYAFTPRLVPGEATALADGERLSRGGVTLEAVHTPGHSSDHLCLRVADTEAVLTGDHVLGRGTTVVAWPDGDMVAYLQSLQRLGALGATVLYPGHGPVLDDPQAAVAAYLAHRRERERQILDALRAGQATAAAVVATVYVDVDPSLHPMAERSVRAHLDKLIAEGAVTVQGREGEETFGV